ncbi:expressed unknown protein [Seminavis robusta]|uniref:Uncharacterized protein n=1 Tax=Seminavis robusta TaxID=568900 RepID=A0A9N8EDT5_9STRA|nr:expressed unknown protein [Seminavis robusta]|eukprot:Sro944_g222980.1 n/a (244) ;mRNA; f:30921-31652
MMEEEERLLLQEEQGKYRALVESCLHSPYYRPSDFQSLSINGKPKLIVASWLDEGGKAAGSALSRFVLGTEYLAGTTELAISELYAPYLDGVFYWVATGRLVGLEQCAQYTASSLRTHMLQLYAIADYFGLTLLTKIIVNRWWPTRAGYGRTLSTANSGVVTLLLPSERGSFGFIKDNQTNEEVWFSLDTSSEINSVLSNIQGLEIFSECRFDIREMAPCKRGKQPKCWQTDAKAINIHVLAK